jgi:hypothetical protein
MNDLFNTTTVPLEGMPSEYRSTVYARAFEARQTSLKGLERLAEVEGISFDPKDVVVQGSGEISAPWPSIHGYGTKRNKQSSRVLLLGLGNLGLFLSLALWLACYASAESLAIQPIVMVAVVSCALLVTSVVLLPMTLDERAMFKRYGSVSGPYEATVQRIVGKLWLLSERSLLVARIMSESGAPELLAVDYASIERVEMKINIYGAQEVHLFDRNSVLISAMGRPEGAHFTDGLELAKTIRDRASAAKA